MSVYLWERFAALRWVEGMALGASSLLTEMLLGHRQNANSAKGESQGESRKQHCAQIQGLRR